jgi:hypothetical protein
VLRKAAVYAESFLVRLEQRLADHRASVLQHVNSRPPYSGGQIEVAPGQGRRER